MCSAADSRDRAVRTKMKPKAHKTYKVPWIEHSKRWRDKLFSLQQLKKKTPDELVDGLGQVALCIDEKFSIGDGSYGTTVYVGLVEDGREVAVKELQKKGNHWKESMQEEVNILAKLTPQENIVSYKWTTWPKGRFGYIILELCEYNLKEWLKQDHVIKQSEDEWKQTAAGLIKGLLSGLRHLHTQEPKIIHRDLKPENAFIVFNDGQECLKLADFGISRAVDQGRNTCVTGKAGTRLWQASEVLQGGKSGKIHYTPATDVQVGGMLAFNILTRGQHPYDAPTDDETERNIRNGEPDLSAVSDPVTVNMLKMMLPVNPKERSPAASLLGHPYLWDDDKRCEFLSTIGNTEEVEKSHDVSRMHLAQDIEDLAVDVFPNQLSWNFFSVKMSTYLDRQHKTDNIFLAHFKIPGYVESTCKLLRTIRNFTHHFATLSLGAKGMFGATGNPYRFVDRELPQLFIAVYDVIKSSAGSAHDYTERQELKKYFSDPA
ncbi:Cyclin-dependent kinase 1 [Lamellibrachia satsuma]|nr:Cyclin-dependent kinase 1 [Lamellibrachia satsuma]